MPKEYINPPELFPSLQYGFSQIVTGTAGKMVFLSGQVGWDETQQIAGAGDLRAQTWQALRNVETAMKAAGGALADVVSMRIYFVEQERDEIRYVREALQAFFPAERAPATTWIAVQGLASREFLIEVEALGLIEWGERCAVKADGERVGRQVRAARQLARNAEPHFCGTGLRLLHGRLTRHDGPAWSATRRRDGRSRSRAGARRSRDRARRSQAAQ